jgi:hypothetical protein
MTEARIIVFLHGAGGPVDSAKWLKPLNHRLVSLGFSRLDAARDRVFAPHYLADLEEDGKTWAEPVRTWQRGSDEDQQGARLAYFNQLEELCRAGRAWERPRTEPGLSWTPTPDYNPMTEGGVIVLKPVRRYEYNRKARWNTWHSVLNQLPKSGSMIVVAHSLGSVVAVDLLTKLPPNLRIELLLTIGSPLALRRLGNPDANKDFPYDRVGAWVNLYDPGDIVTLGRGVGRRFKAACDIAVQTGSSHDAEGYLSTRAAAAVIGHHVFGPPSARKQDDRKRTIQRDLHPAWNPLLLSFAYRAQIASCAKESDWKFKTRVDAARSILARWTIDDIDAKRETLIADETEGLDHSPLGQGRHPNESDLIDKAAALVSGCLPDNALLSLAVGLRMSPPLDPFDVKVGDDLRHEALEKMLNLVRVRPGNISDKMFADAVREGVKAGEHAVAEGDFPWGTVLIGGGALLLALTGVGLLVAAPVGLAGAALITATLAAFGPGGMVGGLVTIATLTGLGAAATGIGVGVDSTEQPLVTNLALRIAVEELAKMPTGAMRNTVASVLSVVDAQARLKFESSAPLVQEILQSTLDIVHTQFAVHDEVAPGRPGTRDVEKKLRLLERALEWLTETHLKDDPLQKARDEFSNLPESMSEVPRPRPQLEG